VLEYKVLLNNELGAPFVPGRGLRQGCPLSPFLFLMCVGGLSALLKKEERRGMVQGMCVSRDAPRINHILFDDDNFFFFRAGVPEARAMKTVLETYATISGQVVNFEKSGAYFTSHTYLMLRAGISVILGVH
ncbi:Uncharacterized mitochondrial protein AtMg01250, partial [Linum grandiflorum]